MENDEDEFFYDRDEGEIIREEDDDDGGGGWLVSLFLRLLGILRA